MPLLYTLCSSSSGNSTFIGNEKNGILVDVGISYRNLKAQMGLINIPITAIKAVFITHEHTDHINGLHTFTKMNDVPVFSSIGTLESILEKNAVVSHTKLFEINKQKPIIGDMEIEAFPTSHDSAESIGIKVNFTNGKTAGVCTDLGYVSPQVKNSLTKCNLVMLESNYDKNMLETGPYPYILKKRIASKTGHLSNNDCSEELVRLFKEGTYNFILAHLSAENNKPETALENAVTSFKSHGANYDDDYKITIAPKMGIGRVIQI